MKIGAVLDVLIHVVDYVFRKRRGQNAAVAQRAMAEGEYVLAAQRLIYARDAEPRNVAVLRLMTLAFWLYSIAVTMLRVRCIIRERA